MMTRHGGRSKRSYYRLFTGYSQVADKGWKTIGSDQLPLLKQENTGYAGVMRKLKINWDDLHSEGPFRQFSNDWGFV